MLSAIRDFFTAPVFGTDIQKSEDAKTTHRVAVALFIIGFLSIPFTFLLTSPTREIALYSTIGGLFIWLGCLWLVKKEQIIIAKSILISLNTLNIYIVIIFNGGFTRPIIIVTFLLLALAVLLFPNRGAVVFGGFNILIGAIIFGLGQAGIIPPATSPVDSREIFLLFFFTALASPIILEIASANSRNLIKRISEREKELSEKNLALDVLTNELEQRVAERTNSLEQTNQRAERRANQLQAVTNIARAISTIRNINDLLPAITRIISERFDFYHVGIFLLDPRSEFADLRAANSLGGQAMLERNHRLRVGEEGIIGYVTKYGRPRIALDVGTDAVYFNNPDLPQTRSEMGLPLIISGEVIGALDVQSEKPEAFTPDDISTLNALASQVAIAIQNAELYTQAENATKEIERAYRSFVQSEWAKVTPGLQKEGYTFSSAGIKPLSAQDKSQSARKGSLTVPVTLRGSEIGEIGIIAPEKEGKLSENETAILQAAAERVALALENARLFQDAQLRAATERAISEMSAKIGASVDVDAILQSTVEELGQLVGDSEIVIQLGKK